MDIFSKLHASIIQRNLDCFKNILKQHPQFNINYTDNRRQTLLMYCCQNLWVGGIHTLLSSGGIDMYIKDRFGKNALMHAFGTFANIHGLIIVCCADVDHNELVNVVNAANSDDNVNEIIKVAHKSILAYVTNYLNSLHFSKVEIATILANIATGTFGSIKNKKINRMDSIVSMFTSKGFNVSELLTDTSIFYPTTTYCEIYPYYNAGSIPNFNHIKYLISYVKQKKNQRERIVIFRNFSKNLQDSILSSSSKNMIKKWMIDDSEYEEELYIKMLKGIYISDIADGEDSEDSKSNMNESDESDEESVHAYDSDIDDIK